MRGFRSCYDAWGVLIGIEFIHVLHKGHLDATSTGGSET